MLEELSVRDFALIEKVSLSFKEGFTVLTGETGAGKSLFIGAISFLLGHKADTGVIRTGAEEAVVSGLFDVSNNQQALAWLSEHKLEAEDGRVLIRRSIKAGGRGSVFIQNQPVLRSDLVGLTSMLADIHGQHSQQSLLSASEHLRILDSFAELAIELESYGKIYNELAAKKRNYEMSLAGENERAREIEMLTFTINEIQQAKLKRGEEEELKVEEGLLVQHEKLYAAVDDARVSFLEREDGSTILAQLRHARAALETAAAIDPSIADLARRADDSYYELEDIAATLRSYLGTLHFSSERLEEIQERLALIQKLKKKYNTLGDNNKTAIDLLLEKQENDQQRLEELTSWDENREEILAEIKKLEAEIYKRALSISSKRSAAGKILQNHIEATLKTLGMPHVQFFVQIKTKASNEGKPVITSTGLDEVEFLIAPNPGESPKPLIRIASGGELSRMALAIKSVLSTMGTMSQSTRAGELNLHSESEPSLLIFDEVDAGIGGEVANAVGKHLALLGKTRQILCITHLATIAVMGDSHFKLEKEMIGDRTTTKLTRMDGEARVEEIARMLSGNIVNQASRIHAQELLQQGGQHG